MAWKDLQAEILEDIAGLQFDVLEAQEAQYSRVRARENEQWRREYAKRSFELKMAQAAVREGVLDTLPEEKRARLKLVLERHAKTMERQRRNQKIYRENVSKDEEKRLKRNQASSRYSKTRRAKETSEQRKKSCEARNARRRSQRARERAEKIASQAYKKPGPMSKAQKKAYKNKARRAARALLRGDLHLVPLGFSIPHWATDEARRTLEAQRARRGDVVDGALERARDADAA